jgi:hypothetical protein
MGKNRYRPADSVASHHDRRHVKRFRPHNHLKTLITGTLCFLLVAVTLLPSMAASIINFRYGKLERSRDVTRAFQTLKISDSYNYYVHGLGNIPYAIIGIDKNYTLREGLWKPVTLTPQKLRGWIRQMDIIYDGFQPYGFDILDDNGKAIGIWYSSKQWTTVILEGERQVAVFTPEPPGFSTP